MLPDLKEIAQKRKELGLTQRELAKLTGISRSWIAKVEAERLMPSYFMTKKIFDELERQLKARTVKMKSIRSFKVEDVHNTKIEYAEIDEQIEEAWKRMENKGYSQLPVRDREKIVGSLTERGVIRKIKETNQEDLTHLIVRDAIEDPFPIINVKTPISLIVDLLQETQAIISFDVHGIVGIVTKADLVSKAFAPES